MSSKIIKVLKNQKVIADKCVVAECFMDRFLGLMGQSKFISGQGLWFPRCNSIHTLFMRMPIDVAFLKKESGGIFRVISVHHGVRPWRLILMEWQASETLELPVGTLDRVQLQNGDELCID